MHEGLSKIVVTYLAAANLPSVYLHIIVILHCNIFCYRGSADDSELDELELPDSLEQLHRQFCLHKTTSSIEPLQATELSTVDDVHLSVLQNMILVGNIVLIF